MSNEQTIEQAIDQMTPGEDADDAYTRLFAAQPTPEDFRRHLHAVRAVPEQMLPLILQTRDQFPDEAYRAAYPEAVTRDEFRQAVAAHRAAVTVEDAPAEQIDTPEA